MKRSYQLQPLLKLRKNIKSTKILNQEIIYSAEKEVGYFEKDTSVMRM